MSEEPAISNVSEGEKRYREAKAKEGMARVRLEPGQTWEFRGQNGHVAQYELVEAAQGSIWARLARLRNIENDGIAHVYCDWLEKGERIAPRSHWRLVST